MNVVVLVGRLTHDPELRSTQSGRNVCSFTMAVDRKFKTQGQPDADFIRVVAWQRQAEVICQYLSKGSQIAVQGRLQSSTYQDKNGVTHYVTDVILESFDFIGSRNNNQGMGGFNNQPLPSFDQPPYGQESSSSNNSGMTPLEIDDDFSLLADDDDVPF